MFWEIFRTKMFLKASTLIVGAALFHAGCKLPFPKRAVDTGGDGNAKGYKAPGTSSSSNGWNLVIPNTSVSSSGAVQITGISTIDGTIIRVYTDLNCGSGLIGAATVASGAFTVNGTTSVDGLKSFYYTSESPSGVTTACASTGLAYVLDTVAPNAATGWALSNPTSGATSSSTTPSFSASAEAIAFVRIYVNDATCGAGNLVSSGSVNSGGTYSSTSSALSTDGLKTFYYTIADMAGNARACAATGLSYTLDTTTPAAATGWALNPASGSTSSDTTPDFTGTGEANSTVRIYVNDNTCAAGNIVSTTTAGGGGAISTTSSALSTDGVKTFYYTIADAQGNTRACATTGLSYTLDTTAPAAATGWALNPASGSTSSDTTPDFTGTGEANSTVRIYVNDNTCGVGNIVSTSTASAGGAISATSSALSTDGLKTFYYTIADASGNTRACATTGLSYTLDTATPAAATGWALNPASGSTSSDTTPDITGTGEANSTVRIYVNDNTCAVGNLVSTSTASAGGAISTTTSALSTDGLKTFYYTIADASGNIRACATTGLSYTLDTTAPAAVTGWALNPASGSTSGDATPDITGTGEANSTVRIYVNDNTCAVGNIVSTSTASAGGAISTTSSTLSPDGLKTFYYTIADASGNTRACATTGLSYTLDTGAPSAVTGWALNPASGSTSSDTTPDFTGTGEANSTVRIYVNDNTCAVGNLVSTSTSDGAGAISATSSALSTDGLKTFYYTITDGQGNATSCATTGLSYTLDTTAPAAATGWALNPASGSTSSDTAPDFTGTGEANSTVKIYVNDNTCAVGNIVSTSTASAGGAISATSSALSTDGLKTFYYTIEDAQGNVRACATTGLSYTLDTTAPAAATGWALNPASGSTSSDTTPDFTGTGEANSTVRIYVNDNTCGAGNIVSTSTTSGGGAISATSSALSTDGLKTFYYTIADASGNTRACATTGLSYTLDTGVSAVTGWALNPTSGSTSSDTTPDFTGTGEANSTVRIYVNDNTCGAGNIVSTSTASGGGAISATSSALSTDGLKTFYYTITDPQGNANTCTTTGLSYTLDTTAPAAATGWALNPASGSTSSDTTPDFTGTGEANSTVRIYVNDNTCAVGNIVSTSTASAGGAISATSSALSTDGLKTFYYTIADASGNTRACATTGLSYTLDTTAPSAVTGWALNPASGSTSSDTAPDFTGTGEANATIRIYVNDNTCAVGNIVSTSTASGGGAISATSSALSTDGLKTFYYTSTDAQGNASACATTGLSYTLDTTAPAAATGWALNPTSGSTSSDTTPDFTGTGEANSTVRIYVNDNTCAVGNIVSTSTASAGGAISATSSALSTDGLKTFYYTIADASGNIRACATTGLSYTLDTTTPSAVTGWALSPTSGSTSTDTTPDFTGTGEANSTVKIYVNDNTCGAGNLISTSTASGVGAISATSSALSTDQLKAFYYTIEDAQGNVRACATTGLSYTLDTTAPTSPSISINAGSATTTSTSVTLTLSATETVSTPMEMCISESATCASCSWEAYATSKAFTLSAGSGTKTVGVRFRDSLSNTGSCTTDTIDYVTDPTSVAITQPLIDGIRISEYDASAFTVKGTCAPNGSNINFSANSGAVTDTTTCASGAFSKNINLSSISDGLVNIAISNAPSTTVRKLVKDTAYCTAGRKVASPFAAGAGTAASPYMICTAAQFNQIASNSTEKHELRNSFDFAGIAGGYTAKTLGAAGTLNGNNFQIHNVSISSAGSDNIGILNITGAATVKNLHFPNIALTGNNSVAVILSNAGAASGYSISNVSTSGAVSCNNRCGGVHDILVGTLSNGYSIASVTGQSLHVGGLVGRMNSGGSISNSFATGAVTTTTAASSAMVGGLLGYAAAGSVSKSFSTSTVVSARSTAGGLIGDSTAGVTISDAFAWGNVTSSNATSGVAGGFAGTNPGTINRSYSIGVPTGGTSSGGFAAVSAGTTTGCFWDSTTSGTGSSAGTATARTTAQMQTQSTFTGASWDFSAAACNPTWIIDTNISGYPVHYWYSQLITDTVAPAAPTFADPHRNGIKISYTIQAAFPISGTCAETAYPVYLTYTDGTVSETEYVPCQSDGTWYVTHDFSAYSNATVTMTARQTDAAGNASSTVTRTMIKNTTYCAVAGNRSATLSTTGTGASGNPYKICTATQLAAMSALSGSGKYFYLYDDIDRNSAATTKLGGFNGILDGQDYTLRNFTMTTSGAGDDGLFTGIGGSSATTLQNLHIRNISVVHASAADLGALTGYLDASAGTVTLNNVSVTGTISGNDYTGGLAGSSGNGTLNMTDVWVKANVSNVDNTLGGLIGYAVDQTSTFTRVTFEGTISQTTNHNKSVGGLVGHSFNVALTCTDCTVDATVTARSLYGGYSGFHEAANMNFTRFYNKGTVTSSASPSGQYACGGIIGLHKNGGSATIANSYNTANISCAGTGGVAGGLIGATNHTSTITKSYNTGNISSTVGSGGIIGVSGDATQSVTDSYSTGTVTVTGTSTGAGGLVGLAGADDYYPGGVVTITRSYSAGLITAGSNKGGLIGKLTYDGAGTNTNSFWDSTTTAIGTTAGTGGTARTTAQMQTSTTFSGASWDMTTVWQMPACTGYPTLR